MYITGYTLELFVWVKSLLGIEVTMFVKIKRWYLNGLLFGGRNEEGSSSRKP